MQDPFGHQSNQDGNGPAGLPLPPNYATVINPETGSMRIQKVGFSWTSFFFPMIPTIFRADWYNLLCMLGIEIGASMLIVLTVTSNNLYNASVVVSSAFSLLWGALYNMMYFKHLFNRGFVPADQNSRELLTANHYWKAPKEK